MVSCENNKMLRFPLRHKPRKFKKSFGPGSGPAEREKRLQMIVTSLIRHERIEGNEGRLDETRQYAEEEKVKTVDFSESIAACDLKDGTCRQLIELMKEKDLVHKLFKVLAPRYAGYQTSFCNFYKLPHEYPGRQVDTKAILELRGNPYPPVIYQHRNNEMLLSNVLLKAARQRDSEMASRQRDSENKDQDR